MKNISKIYIFLIVLFVSMSLVSAENNTEIETINNETNEQNIEENLETNNEIGYNIEINDKNIHNGITSSSNPSPTYFTVLKMILLKVIHLKSF